MPSSAPSIVQYKTLPNHGLSQTPVEVLTNASLFANKWYKKTSKVILIHQRKPKYNIYSSSLGLIEDRIESPGVYTPLSICSGMSVAVNALQSLQV